MSKAPNTTEPTTDATAFMATDIIMQPVSTLIPYANNARTHSEAQVKQIAASIQSFGFTNPILVDGSNGIIAGHGRILAAELLGITEVPTICLPHLTNTAKRAYVLADNRIAINSGWDMETLAIEVQRIIDDGRYDVADLGFDAAEVDEMLASIINGQGGTPLTDPDDVPELPTTTPVSQRGDIWLCGEHRVMCGDSTDRGDVELLMDGKRADMVFTDPPYGMGKENEGVTNDNLNYKALLEFNKHWMGIAFDVLKDNGSLYCFGTDEPLMDIYSEIIKPLVSEQKATFRNLITWDKGVGQGQMAEGFRMYAPADEKCLFVMAGVQGFNTNADNYFEGWEPVRNYLLDQRKKAGWDIPTMKRIAGHSDLSRDHWTGKSQFNMPTEAVYNSFKMHCEANGIDAFKREYDDLKREYDDLKREYYSTRAFFDNTHTNMNSVWHFDKSSGKERDEAGGHSTPKPVELCERAIKTSSRPSELVLDLFLGSGTTLIACQSTNRTCYGMEISPAYVDVIVNRWQNYTGLKATHTETGLSFNDTAPSPSPLPDTKEAVNA